MEGQLPVPRDVHPVLDGVVRLECEVNTPIPIEILYAIRSFAESTARVVEQVHMCSIITGRTGQGMLVCVYPFFSLLVLNVNGSFPFLLRL